jgi:putative glutamine amidotransferase
MQRNIPVLEFCVGHQLLNIVSGGRLILHVHDPLTHMALSIVEDNKHSISIIGGRILIVILDENDITVNMAHHQAIDLDFLNDELITMV